MEYLSNNYPMKITYNLGIDDSSLSFYIAPKISEILDE
jgi:hypothetical protein